METNPFDPTYPDCKDQKSYQSGLEFQDYVVDTLREKLGIVITNYSSQRYQFGIGENKQGIEIKLDRDILRTGNVSIEVAEKTKASKLAYVPSGIYSNGNSWLYIQGNPDIIFVFTKNLLRLLHKSGRYKTDTLPTIQRYLLSLAEAKKFAAKVIEMNTDEQKMKRWIDGAK